MAKIHWMKKAFANAHGQFKKAAAAHGKSTSEYAHEKEHAKGTVGKRARLALVGMRARKK